MQEYDWTEMDQEDSYRKYSVDTAATENSSRKSSVDFSKPEWSPVFQFAFVQPTDTKYTFLKPVK